MGIAPADVKGLYRAAKAGDRAEAKKLQSKLRLAVPLFTNPQASPKLLAARFGLLSRVPRAQGARTRATHHFLKEALRLQGHPITSRVKRPYDEVGPEQSDAIKSLLMALGWLDT